MIETIRIDGVTVLHAPPSGPRRPPVVFVHGYFADASVWSEWLEYFAARSVDAYAVNLRGRAASLSGVVLGEVSVHDFAADAERVVRAVSATVVIGHSMGGLIAQMLAASGLLQAAVLIAPAPPRGISLLSPRLAAKQLKYLPAMLLSRTVVPGRDDLREIVLNRIPAHQQDALLDRMIPDSGRAGREMSITGVRVEATGRPCPMLVIAAEDDRFIPRRVVERVARRYDADLRVAPHHGHMAILEPDWESLADLVERWIRDHT